MSRTRQEPVDDEAEAGQRDAAEDATRDTAWVERLRRIEPNVEIEPQS